MKADRRADVNPPEPLTPKEEAWAASIMPSARIGDAVGLHGAIVAVFELHEGKSRGRIFTTALLLAEASRGSPCRERIAQAIRAQTAYLLDHERN